MASDVWDEIIYPTANFNAATVEVWEWISELVHPALHDGCNYLSIMLRLKLNNDSIWGGGGGGGWMLVNWPIVKLPLDYQFGG